MYFPEQWDPKSPWYDLRVRQAASLAIDRKSINQALTLGFSHITGSIVPETSSSSGRRRPPVTIRQGDDSCSPRRGFRMASMPALISATPPTRISARPC